MDERRRAGGVGEGRRADACRLSTGDTAECHSVLRITGVSCWCVLLKRKVDPLRSFLPRPDLNSEGMKKTTTASRTGVGACPEANSVSFSAFQRFSFCRPRCFPSLTSRPSAKDLLSAFQRFGARSLISGPWSLVLLAGSALASVTLPRAGEGRRAGGVG